MRAALIVFVFACGSSKAPPAKPEPPNPELSPALAPLAWWMGDWQAEDGATGSEHWVASSGVVFGIALQDGGFEVMVIDDGEDTGKADGVLRFIAMPGGAKAVEFRVRQLQSTSAMFANEKHDYPKTIRYARDREQLTATIAGDGKSDRYRFKRASGDPAPALEAADVAFAKDTAARGIEGWVAAFDAQGGMMGKTGRIEGEAIRQTMGPLLATTKIEWAPIASRVRGDLGFTVGKATFTGPEKSWRSTYVTVWKKQTDGSWKVIFDTGRPVNE